jgi:hypothetical protein
MSHEAFHEASLKYYREEEKKRREDAPLAAVLAGGADRVKVGSTIATFGTMEEWRIETLRWC